jgi:hypothetical protein
MVKTMQKMQHAPLKGQTKIVVESHDHKEIVNVAKLQNSMVRLMYATTKTVNWDDCTIKSISLITFTQEYQNLLERSVSVQVTQLMNLIRTIFSTEPDEVDNDCSPLNRLMSLYVFPPKFTKGHLNAMIQSNDLELAAIYKSASINPFHYAPQLDQVLVAAQRRKSTKSETKRVLQLPKATIRKILHSSRELEKSIPWTTSHRFTPIFVESNLPLLTSPRASPLLYQYA